MSIEQMRMKWQLKVEYWRLKICDAKGNWKYNVEETRAYNEQKTNSKIKSNDNESKTENANINEHWTAWKIFICIKWMNTLKLTSFEASVCLSVLYLRTRLRWRTHRMQNIVYLVEFVDRGEGDEVPYESQLDTQI